ncbi:RDD family protein [Enemella sp. A6]|uniref:RDD family protein n=1 Tax=Enemella sp. A6 TaxID=3440152 RepID=UPI003EBF141D
MPGQHTPRPPAPPQHRPQPGPPTRPRGRVVPPTRDPVPGLTTDDGVLLAGFWWRFLAAGIDQILLGFVGFMLALPFMGPLFDGLVTFWGETMEATRTGSTPPVAPTYGELLPFGNQLAIALVLAGLQLSYHILLWHFRGATLGQLALGLRVVPVGEGRSIERLGYSVVVPRAVIWSIPWCLSSLYFIGMINALWSLWNPRRMAVHDLVAKTQVIRTRE